MLKKGEGGFRLEVLDPHLLRRLESLESLKPFWAGRVGETAFLVPDLERGRLKHALIRLGYPVQDLAGYAQGAPLEVSLRPATLQGKPFGLRDYQELAVSAFLGRGEEGGSGVVTLPCGADKTIENFRVDLMDMCIEVAAKIERWMTLTLERTYRNHTLLGHRVDVLEGRVKALESRRRMPPRRGG